MTAAEFLDFLHVAERLKSEKRHCVTAAGLPEVVAAHSWRMTLMALLLAPEFPELDMNRVIRMCIVHDLGEAVTGDIPSFVKTEQNEETERDKQTQLVKMLPDPQGAQLGALFSELEARETPEARFYKALDRLEAVLQHNESDLSTWLPLEYELNKTYGTEDAAQFPLLAAVRAQMREDTEEKIRKGV